MEKSSQIAWKIVPLRHFFPLKVVPLIEVLLYGLLCKGITLLEAVGYSESLMVLCQTSRAVKFEKFAESSSTSVFFLRSSKVL
jgi:hypothetical protein